MGLFKFRIKKRHNHSGRFSERKSMVGTHSKPRKIKSKFDHHTSSVHGIEGFRDKTKKDYDKTDNSANKRALLVFTLLIVVASLIYFT